jgi:hypothetical protein
MKDSQQAVEEHNKKGRWLLSNIEAFSLATGIIGLVVDTISLVSFAVGAWRFGNGDNSGTSGRALFVLITGLVLVYGWLMSAWMITRQALNRVPSAPYEKSLDDTAARSTVGIGLILAPLAVIWFAIAFGGGGASPQTLVSVTPTIVPTTSAGSDFATPTTMPGSAEKTDVAMGIVFGELFAMLFLYPLVGLGLWGCQSLVMPLVYSDLESSDIPATVETARVRADIDENWDSWEKRISIELGRYNWVTVNRLQDMADLLGAHLESIELAFAKYASTHAVEVKYGHLHNAPGFLISDFRVLVNSDYDLGEWYLD